LLSYDDEGIRDLDEHEEIPYDILSPLNNGFAKKNFEPVSVKSKVKIKRNKK
jgi:hypothetical protein